MTRAQKNVFIGALVARHAGALSPQEVVKRLDKIVRFARSWQAWEIRCMNDPTARKDEKQAKQKDRDFKTVGNYLALRMIDDTAGALVVAWFNDVRGAPARIIETSDPRSGDCFAGGWAIGGRGHAE